VIQDRSDGVRAYWNAQPSQAVSIHQPLGYFWKAGADSPSRLASHQPSRNTQELLECDVAFEHQTSPYVSQASPLTFNDTALMLPTIPQRQAQRLMRASIFLLGAEGDLFLHHPWPTPVRPGQLAH
jgi:hypothetical protein